MEQVLIRSSLAALLILLLQCISFAQPIIVGVGPDGTYACNDSPIFSSPTANSGPNCPGIATISFSDAPSGSSCAGTGIARTWIATDDCGNTTTASQTMLPDDIIAPVISGVGPDGTYGCSQTPVFSNPNSYDDCSIATLSYTDTTSPGVCNSDIITRTWTSMDDCGNTSTASQIMTPVSSNDHDSDGIINANDNCVYIANPGQEDVDGDGIGDLCDPNNVFTNITNIQGNVYLDHVYSGIIVKSPDGNCWMIVVHNDGTLQTIDVDCP